MKVSELIKRLRDFPQDFEVCNGKATSLNTLLPIERVGTIEVICYRERLTIEEYKEPLNIRDEPTKKRKKIVIIR